jgi:NAD(P)-dependent dehydrogenase (short-subunit alcohol dehydrogenase family)
MNILVTGGSKGIGAAIVKLLSANGHVVYFTYANSQDAAKQLAETAGNIHTIHCDFTDTVSVEKLAATIAAIDIDVLVNNANTGIQKGHFNKLTNEVFRTSFEVNVLPVLRITQEAINHFRKKKAGKIINIISTVVVGKPPIGWSEYTANKAYLLAMSKSWATENIRFNITSNCISPAFVLTDIHKDEDERVIEQIIAGHPLKKLLTPEEVAEAVQYFVNASTQVNGTNLVLNAGTEML